MSEAEILRNQRKRLCVIRHYEEIAHIRVMKIYKRINQKTSIQFMDYALSRLPFRAHIIQTDN